MSDVEEEVRSLPEVIETEQVVEVMEDAQFLDLAATLETRGEEVRVEASGTAVGCRFEEGEEEEREEEAAEEAGVLRQKRKRSLEESPDTEGVVKRKGMSVAMSHDTLLRLSGSEVCALSCEEELQLVATYLGLHRTYLRDLSPSVAAERTYFGGQVVSQCSHPASTEVILQDEGTEGRNVTFEVLSDLSQCLPPSSLLGECQLFFHGARMELEEEEGVGEGGGGEGKVRVAVERGRGVKMWIIHR